MKRFYTIQQISEMFGYTPSTIKNNFNRTASAIKKKYDYQIYKVIKPGDKIHYYELYKDDRALTIYQEEKDFPITQESLSYDGYKFFVFLTLTADDQGVWRGTREQLLKYFGVKNSKKNRQDLDKVIKNLVQEKCIEAKYQEKKIVLYLVESVQDELSVNIQMIRKCKQIIEQGCGKRKSFEKLSQLIRVWKAIEICEEHQPFTNKQLSQMTGLSVRQIMDVKSLLKYNNAFATKRVFLEDGIGEGNWNCIGSVVDLNGFYLTPPSKNIKS